MIQIILGNQLKHVWGTGITPHVIKVVFQYHVQFGTVEEF